jgi:hypothetical protein
MALFRRKPEARFHARHPRIAGAIGGALGGLIVAGGIYAMAVAFGSTNIGLSVALVFGAIIGGLAGAVFPRFGHRSLFYVWCMALGIYRTSPAMQ